MKVVAANDLKPRNPSFAKSITQNDALVYDLRAVVNDEQRYFIIRVMPAKQAAFLQTVEKDAGFRLEDYGDVLYRGWDEPEDNLKKQLRQEYGLPYPEPQAG
jgi:hypothetical protein